jgi:Zn finger protein HypA/HybF involved in hydrogenase expression
MKITLSAQCTIPLTRADNLQVAQTHDSIYVQTEEETVNCPDCFDTMVKMYQTDKIRYQCENCDLIIPDIEVQIYE